MAKKNIYKVTIQGETTKFEGTAQQIINFILDKEISNAGN